MIIRNLLDELYIKKKTRGKERKKAHEDLVIEHVLNYLCASFKESAIKNASSRAWSALRRGSQCVW